MDTIAILDFGGQYTHLIANRIRRLGVYSEILPTDIPAQKCARFKGIILSGSPHSVLAQQRPGFDPGVLELGIPVLGLCYGHQLIAQSQVLLQDWLGLFAVRPDLVGRTATVGS